MESHGNHASQPERLNFRAVVVLEFAGPRENIVTRPITPRSGFCSRERSERRACRRNMHRMRNAACEARLKTATSVQHPRMAIAFARARYMSRASGGNAVRSAAYNARESIAAERTGEVFSLPPSRRARTPRGAAARGRRTRFADSAVLWNAAEAAEKRKDAQVAREIVLALPADRAITTEDRIELARSFAEQHFVAKGLAVQLDVHAPHKERGEGEGAFEGTGGDQATGTRIC